MFKMDYDTIKSETDRHEMGRDKIKNYDLIKKLIEKSKKLLIMISYNSDK